jgi:hypothetical protein
MNDRSDDGFFTLEAIAALTIASIVLVGYLQVTAVALQATAQVASREQLLSIGLSEIENASGRGMAETRKGAGDYGNTWTVRTVPIAIKGEVLAKAYWAIFEARDAKGAIIIELKTIKTATGAP